VFEFGSKGKEVVKTNGTTNTGFNLEITFKPEKLQVGEATRNIQCESYEASNGFLAYQKNGERILIPTHRIQEIKVLKNKGATLSANH
jgi:uncharacterized protein (UPF0248 family)